MEFNTVLVEWRPLTSGLRPLQRCRVEPSEKVKYLVYLVFGMLYRYTYVVYIMYLCRYRLTQDSLVGIADIIEVTKQCELQQHCVVILEIYQFEDKTSNPVLRG